MQKDLLIDSKNAYIFYINISIRLPLAFTLNFPELKKILLLPTFSTVMIYFYRM